MRANEDNVGLVSGCGRATIEKLAHLKIVTVGDLVAYRGDDMMVKRIQTQAKKELQKKHIRCHSWYGCVAHVIRSSGTHRQRVTRATVGSLVFEPYALELDMMWLSPKGEKVHKRVSPSMLLCTQQAWNANDIVSDASESPSDSDSELIDKGLGEKYRCADVTKMLPFFTLDMNHKETKNLTTSEARGIKKLIKETQQFKIAFDDLLSE